MSLPCLSADPYSGESAILTLPNELLSRIIERVNRDDILRIRQVCHGHILDDACNSYCSTNPGRVRYAKGFFK